MQAIVSVDRNLGLGKDGRQHCFIASDLKRFKKLTLGRAVVYGRKTMATFPDGKPLRGRENFVFSRDAHFHPEGVRVLGSLAELEECLEEKKRQGVAEEDFIVIGGASIYRLLWNRVRTLKLTRIDAAFDSDAYLPNPEKTGFRLIFAGRWQEDEGRRFRYEHWLREGSEEQPWKEKKI